jgi:SnoaL-like domain
LACQALKLLRMPPLSPLDRLEIRELAARYSWADDTADGEAFAAVFTPDGGFGSTRHTVTGHAELAALGRSIAPAPPAGIQHWVTNMVIEGDFERARSACYFVLHSIDATGTVRTGSPG